MDEMFTQASDEMKDTKCPSCDNLEMHLNPNNFETSCVKCGLVVCHSFTITHTTAKGKSGELEKQGTITNIRSGKLNYDSDAPFALLSCSNREKCLKKVSICLDLIVSKLDMDLQTKNKIETAKENALSIWCMCYSRGMTRGYSRETIAAIVFYMASRKMGLPFLLLDLSTILKKNVLKLAKVFGKLCKDLPLKCPLNDPTLLILRFISDLQFGDKEQLVGETALKVLTQMKKDWITQGRRPSGYVGAAIWIASRLNNFQRSPNQIVKVVGLTEGTIIKRIHEFANTKCAKEWTVNDFKMKLKMTEIEKNCLFSKELPPVMKQQKMKKEKDKLKREKQEKQEKTESENDFDILEFLKTETGNAKNEKKDETVFVSLKCTDEFEENNGNNNNNNNNLKRRSSDLSDLDDDREVNSMVLAKKEANAKNIMWETLNPDWDIVKFEIDKKEKLKQEKQERMVEKRKLDDLYKNEPHLLFANRVKKKFKSSKLNVEVFYKLMGTNAKNTKNTKNENDTNTKTLKTDHT